MKKQIKRRVVFFVYSPEEASYATEYTKSHPEQKVKIVPASISAHLVLHKTTSLSNESQNVSQIDKNYSEEFLQIKQKKTHEIYTQLLHELKPYYVHDVNQIEVMKILLQEEILYVLQAYDIFLEINKEYSPDEYHFPKELNSKIAGWDPSYFALAALMKEFYCPKSKVKLFSTTKNNSNKLFVKYTSLKTIYKKIITIVELLFIRTRDEVRSSLTKTCKILMFSGGYNLYYYNRLLNLDKNSTYLNIQILTGTQSIEDELLLRKNNVHFLPLEKLNDFKVRREINLQLNSFNTYINHEIKRSHIRKALPRNIPEEVCDAIYFKINLILKYYANKSIKQSILAHRALEKFTPNLVVTTHDPGPSALPFVLSAKSKKITTLLLLHGYHTMSFLADHQSDILASWGPVLKAGFVNKLHKNPRSIFSVGFPFLDTYFKNGGVYHKKDLLKMKKSHARMRLGVLLTLHPGDHLARPQFIFDLFEAISASALPIEIQIRAHAGQNVISIEDLAKYFGVDCICNESIGLDQFIQQNDVILSWDTTAILWAAIYHKPILYTTPWWRSGSIPIAKYRAGRVVTSAKSLISELHKIRENPNISEKVRNGQNKFLQDVLGVIDGTSTEKLKKLLESLSRKVQTKQYK